MHYICEVEHASMYKLRLVFEDGITIVVDLEDHLDGEVFAPLRDLRLFQTARLNRDIDTVVWENGADMSPDFLHEIGVPVDSAERSALCVAEGAAQYGGGKKK